MKIIILILISICICGDHARAAVDSAAGQTNRIPTGSSNNMTAISTGMISMSDQGHNIKLDTNAAPVSKEGPKAIEQIVVSRSPDFFTFTLNAVGVLLSIVTILIGAITGVGLALVYRLARDRKKLEETQVKLAEEHESARLEMRKEYDKMLAALKRTAFGVVKLQQAKRDLRDLLSDAHPDPDKIYAALQRTVAYPDADCLRLYARTLTKLETNVDVVRLIRNGILQYSRNPVTAADSPIECKG